eukprot:GFUD01022702.1.p1 GENE.GFUD01022702.1~~GFUD01022702.1.p1  ORF type:complete len:901 (-),score=273.37 GFUD01022702.1:151-2853(-)
MPPKPRLGGSTSGSSSSSSNSSSSGSSSSSSSGSDSSSDSESSQASKKGSPSKTTPKSKEHLSAEKNKKKNSAKKSGFVTNNKAPPKPIFDDASDAAAKEVQSVEKIKKDNSSKKSGFVTNKKAPPRPISDDASDTDCNKILSAEKNKKNNSAKKSGVETNKKSPPKPIPDNASVSAKKKLSGKKAAAPMKPNVVPKKSAIAKTILKGGFGKSKKYIDTESDSDIGESTVKHVQNKDKVENKKISQKKQQKSSLAHKSGSNNILKSKIDTESDDTDTSLIRDLPKSRKNSPAPPALTPQKQKPKANVKNQNSKSKGNQKFRHSSVESIGNSSLDSDTEDTDSSMDQKMKKRSKKGHPISPKKEAIHGSLHSSKVKSSPASPVSNVSNSDTDTETSAKMERRTTRKQTRGTTIKKSVHITGRRADGSSESDSDNDDGGGNQSKKTTGAIAKIFRPRPQYPPLENRKCPVPRCDSKGHLSGKLERHFTHDACPLYHNTTAQACKDNLVEYNRKDAARKKALMMLSTKSPLTSPSDEQKKYHEKIKQERLMKEEPISQDEEDEVPITDREMSLKGLPASSYDLALFREAQAKASKEIEEQLKGLPDVTGTKYMEMGRNEMVVWYQSPYPEEYTLLPKIYICEFCLKYMKEVSVMKRHASKCVWKHPPGDEIYRKEKLSVFEVCGKKYKQYCQNLCLIAKAFLDHKTLYYDVEPFLFYVVTVADSEGCHFVGYFSKEKNSFLNYNLSCILTLPPYQRQGYGRLLIDFSYLLSKTEGKIGSPEKPLSDLGLISYRNYWKDIILYYLITYPDREISFKAISEEMGIQPYDIVSTLQFLEMIKYWKGKHIIIKKENIIEDYLERTRRRPKDKEISAEYLKWKPYEPSAKEKRHAEQIKKKQEERQGR